MDQLVGRLTWTTVEVATDAIVSGGTDIWLADIDITPEATTRKSERLSELLAGILPDDPQVMEKIMGAHELLEEEVSRGEEDFDRITDTWYSKKVAVNETYGLEYSEFARPHAVGFGLAGVRFNEGTFSWDWFNATSPTKATKLQEAGEISFTTKETPCGSEIVWMRFDTDVSIRIATFEQAAEVRPSWRINIHKGSEIYWPSLVDGEVVANGFVAS